MRHLRRVVPLVVLALFAMSGPAQADDVLLSMTVLGGTRSITSANLGAIANVVHGLSTSATLTSVVTETVADGVNGWAMKVRLCGPNNLAVPTAADCTAYPDEVVLATDDTKTVPGNAVTISARNVVQLLSGGTSTAVTGLQDLSGQRTIFNNTGQSALQTYTGTHTATATVALNPSASATTGVYKGFLVVTIV
jgi:hypothetical protein